MNTTSAPLAGLLEQHPGPWRSEPIRGNTDFAYVRDGNGLMVIRGGIPCDLAAAIAALPGLVTAAEAVTAAWFETPDNAGLVAAIERLADLLNPATEEAPQ